MNEYDEDRIKGYQSMRASLAIGDEDGDTVTLNSIVDSGAAWCALNEADRT